MKGISPLLDEVDVFNVAAIKFRFGFIVIVEKLIFYVASREDELLVAFKKISEA